MPDHPARFPGVTNDPAKHTFTARQATRLAALTHVPATDSQTAAVNLAIDATPPSIEFLDLLWRHPDVSLGWQSLPLTSSTECPVIHRASNARIHDHPLPRPGDRVAHRR
jgi:hypothetical protein